MKKYDFERGRIVGDLTADGIKKAEKKLGKLVGVQISGYGFVPCLYDDRHKPVEELTRYKKWLKHRGEEK